MAKTLRAKCLVALQKLVRLKAADDNGYARCWSCGVFFHYKEMDGGHYLAAGCSSYWALREENVHPQCKGCNGFGMKFGIASQQYTVSMIDHFGRDFVTHMLETKSKPIKLYKADYEDMLKDFNEQIRFHEKRVCG